MFKGRVYRIMIGGPSDIIKEIPIAKLVIADWNDVNADSAKMVLLPLHWSSNAYPTTGSHPQKTIDKQIVSKSDMLVCIFAAKIGSPTDTAESGSIEEIEEHIKAGKPVMLFFRKQVDISKTKSEEIEKLNAFKVKMRDKSFYNEYEDDADFEKLFTKKLQLSINDMWYHADNDDKEDDESISIAEIDAMINDAKDKSEDDFTEEELQMFSKWANNSVDSSYSAVHTVAGLNVYMGYHNAYTFQRGREQAWFEDFMQRLQDKDLIILDHYDRYNQPMYKVTKQGYDFAQSLVK